uniref:Glyceraldehyde 3-phosphate dehydrogenase NAD(P) binding domain-containing protein n=1 Tax=viral metagenome TaxID=1070528 RepID=A0A6C0BQW8_9ZZZZ
MINIGINGFGRIGKSLLLQSLTIPNIKVCTINNPYFDIKTLTSYLLHDSCHKMSLRPRDIYHLNNNTVFIKGQKICIMNKLNKDLEGKKIWNPYTPNDIKYLIDTTGNVLTTDNAQMHNVPYFIMCAPPEDKTPQFIFNGNHEKYNGERIISNSSSTTNALVPLLKIFDETVGVDKVNFITVHSSTSSQNVTDNADIKSRIHRSIINNIIPYKTGASISTEVIMPKLEGKVFGTSVRVPTNNVSMINVTVHFEMAINIYEMLSLLRPHNNNSIIINEDPYVVSSDFITTEIPTIIDLPLIVKISEYEYNFTIWYDNEWSYSTQILKLIKHLEKINI